MDARLNRYWMSHSYHEGQESISFPYVNSFRISVVLDFEARIEFSAIRLLILCKQREHLDAVRISKCIDPNQCLSLVRETTPPRRRYRTRLVTESETHNETQVSMARVCTVAFELIPEHDGWFNIVFTSIRRHHLDKNSTPIQCVVYDYIHPLDPTNPALLVHLSINQFMVPYVTRSSPERRINAHSIRVVPMPSNRRKPFIALPPNIVRHIARYAVQARDAGWRPALLNYSLVCKAWEHVIELFFSFTGSGWNPVRARHILRTLRWRPHYGSLIQYHTRNTYLYRDVPSDLEDIVKILRYTPHVKHLHLPLIPLKMIDEVLSILRNLREVWEFVVRQPEVEDDLMNMADFQMAIANWKDLTNIRLSGFGAARTSDSKYPLPDHLDCKIEFLSLRKGEELTPGQLLRFASPANCHLTNLTLESIKGPSNAEFRTFLSIAAPTLTTINLHSCSFPRSPDEEFALDAIVPQMKQIVRFKVLSSDVSILSVVRKAPSPPLPLAHDIPRNDHIWILLASLEITIEDVERAMYVTEWSSVTIIWKFRPVWDPHTVRRAEEAARSRGIKLKLQ